MKECVAEFTIRVWSMGQSSIRSRLPRESFEMCDKLLDLAVKAITKEQEEFRRVHMK